MDIKKFSICFLIYFLLISPTFAQVEQSGEIQRFVFELDEVAQVLEGSIETTQEQFLGDYIEIQKPIQDDTIFLETGFAPAYKTNEIKKVSTYSKSLEAPQNADFRLKNGAISIGSRSYQYNDTTTIIKNVRQELGATVEKNRFSLTGGLETTYDTTNTSSASRAVFLTPKIKLSETTSISLKNKINQDATKYEPTLGLDYTPKNFQNSNVWFGAGATFRNNMVESQSLNLKTNFYLF